MENENKPTKVENVDEIKKLIDADVRILEIKQIRGKC
jgi:hypothetical protein